MVVPFARSIAVQERIVWSLGQRPDFASLMLGFHRRLDRRGRLSSTGMRDEGTAAVRTLRDFLAVDVVKLSVLALRAVERPHIG